MGDRSEKSRILQDRGTSPGLETSQQDAGGSRIGRASDIYSVRKTTYYQPNTQEKSFQYTSYSDKTKATSVNDRLEKQKEKEEEASKKYNMASDWPGTLPQVSRK